MTGCPTCTALVDRVLKLEVQVAWLRDMPGLRASPIANIHKIRKTLTRVELDTLRAIRNYWARNSVGPRMDDLGKSLGITPQAANERCRRLVNRGLAAREAHVSRSVRVLYDPDGQGVA